jgi:hypothetical protein
MSAPTAATSGSPTGQNRPRRAQPYWARPDAAGILSPIADYGGGTAGWRISQLPMQSLVSAAPATRPRWVARELGPRRSECRRSDSGLEARARVEAIVGSGDCRHTNAAASGRRGAHCSSTPGRATSVRWPLSAAIGNGFDGPYADRTHDEAPVPQLPRRPLLARKLSTLDRS